LLLEKKSIAEASNNNSKTKGVAKNRLEKLKLNKKSRVKLHIAEAKVEAL
jgi:hypothetical protein